MDTLVPHNTSNMKTEILKCDIKNREHSGSVETKRVQCIFDHDQDDGKSKLKPHLCWEDIEMCEQCWNAMLEERKYIYAYGAMGYKTYTL